MSGTTLKDFLSHFSSSEGIWIKQLDPLATFDVTFKFYPNIFEDAKEDSRDWLQKIGDAAKSAAKTAVNNLANNLTGGLIGSFFNSKVSITDKQKEYAGDATEMTFMNYLAAANLLVGKDDCGWITDEIMDAVNGKEDTSRGQSVKPLELQLGLYCQEITIPNLEVPQGGTSVNQIGEFPINGVFVKTDSNILTMKILNTKVPLMERIFYPWLRETTLPWWSYNTQPYTTATITVDMSKHNDIQYIFVGCRPQKIITQDANQNAANGNLIRDVSFLFDYMYIGSSLKNCETVEDRLKSTGMTLLNGAANMVGIR